MTAEDLYNAWATAFESEVPWSQRYARHQDDFRAMSAELSECPSPIELREVMKIEACPHVMKGLERMARLLTKLPVPESPNAKYIPANQLARIHAEMHARYAEMN